MPNILADVTRITENTRAVFTGEKLKVGQWARCLNTDVPERGAELVVRNAGGAYVFYPLEGYTDAEIDAFISGLQSGINSKVNVYRSGWDDTTDLNYRDGLTFTWDSGTRTVSITHSSGFVKLWTYNTFYNLPNGDPKLSVQVGTVDRTYGLYFDATGQLVQAALFSIPSTVYNTACIAGRLIYSDTDNNEILAIKELHNASEPNGLSARLHNTTGSVYSSGGDLVGIGASDTFCGIENIIFYDEDIRITAIGQPDSTSAIFPKYGLLGVDADGQIKIERGSLDHRIAWFDTGTGRPLYNNFNSGTGLWELLPIAANEFCCVHMKSANSMFTPISISMVVGQGKYSSISSARAGILDEIFGLKSVNGVVREAIDVYTFIVNASGQVQDIGNGSFFADLRGADLLTIKAHQQFL